MEFIITHGQFQVLPIPADGEGAPADARAGYLLAITDQATGIIVRVSMAHANAAELGMVLVTDTEEHPAWSPLLVEGPGGVESVLRVLPDQQGEGGQPV